jgi:hypothetical protein
VARVGSQHDPGVIPEGDDRDRITTAQTVDQLPQRILDQLEAIALGHRTRGVDDERERRVGRARSDESRALMPTLSRIWRPSRNGVGAPSTWIANVPSSGAG